MRIIECIKQALTAHSEYLFPAALILLDFAAAVVYFRHGDYKKAVYWIAAAVLNICVTF